MGPTVPSRRIRVFVHRSAREVAAARTLACTRHSDGVRRGSGSGWAGRTRGRRRGRRRGWRGPRRRRSGRRGRRPARRRPRRGGRGRPGPGRGPRGRRRGRSRRGRRRRQRHRPVGVVQGELAVAEHGVGVGHEPRGPRRVLRAAAGPPGASGTPRRRPARAGRRPRRPCGPPPRAAPTSTLLASTARRRCSAPSASSPASTGAGGGVGRGLALERARRSPATTSSSRGSTASPSPTLADVPGLSARSRWIVVTLRDAVGARRDDPLDACSAARRRAPRRTARATSSRGAGPARPR